MFKKILFSSLLITLLFVLVGCKKTLSDSVVAPANQPVAEQNKPAGQDAMAQAIARAQKTIPADIKEDPVSDKNVFYIYRYFEPGSGNDMSADCVGNYTTKGITRNLETGESAEVQAFRSLLSGQVTEAEKAEGYLRSLFTDLNFTINNISVDNDGVLYIDLEDNEVLQRFSECWGSIFSTAVYRTASQFDNVKRVKFAKYFVFEI